MLAFGELTLRNTQIDMTLSNFLYSAENMQAYLCIRCSKIRFFPHLFVPLTSSKVLSFDKKKNEFFCFVLTYSYLCRQNQNTLINKV